MMFLIFKSMLFDNNCQNCEGSEILNFLQAKKLGFHSFMDGGRRQKVHDSRYRTFTYSSNSNQSIRVYWAVPLNPNSHRVLKSAAYHFILASPNHQGTLPRHFREVCESRALMNQWFYFRK